VLASLRRKLMGLVEGLGGGAAVDAQSDLHQFPAPTVPHVDEAGERAMSGTLANKGPSPAGLTKAL
jgi:hypothetical protein